MKKKNKKPVKRFNALFPGTLLHCVPRQHKSTAAILFQSAQHLYEAGKLQADTVEINGSNIVRLLNLVLNCIGTTKSPEVKMIKTIMQQLPKAQYN